VRKRNLLLVWVTVLRCGLAFAAPILTCTSANEYRLLLERIDAAARDPETSFADLARQIPAECDFSAGDQSFKISNSALQASLRSLAASADPDARISAQQQLQKAVTRRLQGLQADEQPIDPSLPTKLDHIFARREFRNVGKQEASATLQEWISQGIVRLLSLIFNDPARVETTAKIIVYASGIVVSGLVIWVLTRWALRPLPHRPIRQPARFSPAARAWRDWLHNARTAADEGRFREAVHAAYWAVISHLEASGTWRPDVARTPREYLNLVSRSNPVLTPLREITLDFEFTWYGNHVPTVTQWQLFLTKVEEIGCR
jgi:hypothetical protein